MKTHRTANSRMPALLATLVLLSAVLLASSAFSAESGKPAGAAIDLSPRGNQAPPPLKEDADGPENELHYFEQWHQQYGAVLPADVVKATWEKINQMPAEPLSGVNAWGAIGPFGSTFIGNPGTRYTGRILDIDDDGGILRVASASGGLWEPVFHAGFAVSDNVNSLACGSFASQPGTDGQIMLLGTGEPFIRSGTGLWKTYDFGNNWTNVPMSPTPGGFFRIRYTPDNPMRVHAATDVGYFRSDDGGQTWTLKLAGTCTDLAVSPQSTHTVLTGIYGDGLYFSSNNGDTWTKVTTSGIPTANVGRVAVSMPANPSYAYIAMERLDNHQTLGIWRTTNYGTTWTNVSPPWDYHWGQGWYNNVIAEHPSNSAVCVAGGGALIRTTDGGANWTVINDLNLHSDIHALYWADSNNLICGNDGGLSESGDAGATWNTVDNAFPITQYVNFDVGVNDTGVIFGGSQDNGITGTTDGGATWTFVQGGDGGGTSIDTGDASRMWCTLGEYSGPWLFRRERSLDHGQSWDNSINSGIDPDGSSFPKIRNDRVSPVYLYTHGGPWVYKSTDYGNNWSKLNTSALPAWLYNLNVSTYSGGYSVVWASMTSGTPGQQLRVYDQGTWYERSAGLPSGLWVRGVAVKPNDSSKAYALMTGFVDGQKVFKTTDTGRTWTNISSNLPNVPMGDLVTYPDDDNQLWLGTEFGCFRTTNGGAEWQRWNDGMPEANIVTEMGAIDRRNIDGTYNVVAATYGRGIWVRQVSGADASVEAGKPTLKDAIAALHNSPNPFKERTSVSFNLRQGGPVDVLLYDAGGREVDRVFHGPLQAGPNHVSIDGSRIKPGVYWCVVNEGGRQASRRMVAVP